jgi:hypothetical protein
MPVFLQVIGESWEKVRASETIQLITGRKYELDSPPPPPNPEAGSGGGGAVSGSGGPVWNLQFPTHVAIHRLAVSYMYSMWGVIHHTFMT